MNCLKHLHGLFLIFTCHIPTLAFSKKEFRNRTFFIISRICKFCIATESSSYNPVVVVENLEERSPCRATNWRPNIESRWPFDEPKIHFEREQDKIYFFWYSSQVQQQTLWRLPFERFKRDLSNLVVMQLHYKHCLLNSWPNVFHSSMPLALPGRWMV